VITFLKATDESHIGVQIQQLLISLGEITGDGVEKLVIDGPSDDNVVPAISF